MDREQEQLQFIGFGGIIKEACKIIYTWRKIFTKITFSFIFPLTIIYLAYPQLDEILCKKIEKHEETKQWVIYICFTIAYLLLVLFLLLLSTSAVVYTIACIYTAKQFTFRKVLSVIPNVWRRFMTTFAYQFLIMLAYNFMALLVLIPVFVIMLAYDFVTLDVFIPLLRWMDEHKLYVLIICAFGYSIVFVYMNVIWNLANVVSVLEDFYGFGAIENSKALIKVFELNAGARAALVIWIIAFKVHTG
ncbi:polyadenylate-binding protein 1-B-binding protein [Thalictrum thalictroides]|uniref:Polyadenylate-binding protein 1-B-binding protein n=1 Tax=Thalictrum thalictroides TaxID=46969 RepID=A0A7J6WSP0_THATH|nr:polyadenylate-binding protein 1-B-binding protein [Thalictrum thalictroides]